MARVGFVGLGLMGLPMALRIHAAGHEMVVCSASAAAVSQARDAGARVAASVAELAAEVSILCSCRVSPDQSREVFGQAARAGRPGLVINFVTDRDQALISQLDSVQPAPGGKASRTTRST